VFGKAGAVFAVAAPTAMTVIVSASKTACKLLRECLRVFISIPLFIIPLFVLILDSWNEESLV
jgi:ABC-type nitrate/sulfonate/bicarbonate transport system permease component